MRGKAFIKKSSCIHGDRCRSRLMHPVEDQNDPYARKRLPPCRPMKRPLMIISRLFGLVGGGGFVLVWWCWFFSSGFFFGGFFWGFVFFFCGFFGFFFCFFFFVGWLLLVFFFFFLVVWVESARRSPILLPTPFFRRYDSCASSRISAPRSTHLPLTASFSLPPFFFAPRRRLRVQRAFRSQVVEFSYEINSHFSANPVLFLMIFFFRRELAVKHATELPAYFLSLRRVSGNACFLQRCRRRAFPPPPPESFSPPGGRGVSLTAFHGN